jgi:hypothetical protein
VPHMYAQLVQSSMSVASFGMVQFKVSADVQIKFRGWERSEARSPRRSQHRWTKGFLRGVRIWYGLLLLLLQYHRLS